MSTQKISDIPTLKVLMGQAEGFSVLTSILRGLPFLGRLIGLSREKVEEFHATAAENRARVKDIVRLLDRFHTHFSGEGWIFYESMNIPAARHAVELADRGDLESARQALVDHYSDELINFHLLRLSGLECGRDRRRLLSLAREDYAAGRYHACIPVVLAQMDGMVNDLQERGFFAEGSDLTAQDSLAGHSEGLTKLAGFLRKGRNKTRDEQLTVPYRNGIMHGADLGYDNKMVAAKCWAALFATADWARLVEHGHRDGKPQKPSPGFGELLHTMSELAEVREALEAWRPREIRVGIDIPVTGSPDDYNEGTPERVVVEFLTLWMERNYGKMATLMASTWGERRKLAGTMRSLHHGRLLRGFELVSCQDTSPAITEVEIKLRLDLAGAIPEPPLKKIRVIWETEDGRPAVRGRGDGRWRILTSSC